MVGRTPNLRLAFNFSMCCKGGYVNQPQRKDDVMAGSTLCDVGGNGPCGVCVIYTEKRRSCLVSGRSFARQDAGCLIASRYRNLPSCLFHGESYYGYRQVGGHARM